MAALGNSSEDVKKNFLAGHSCGDELDLDENGRPQMALRISFGYHNSKDDIAKLVGFFEDFVKRSNLENQGREQNFKFSVSFYNFGHFRKIFLTKLKNFGLFLTFSAAFGHFRTILLMNMNSSGRFRSFSVNF